MTPSRNTRSYTLRSVPSSPGRSFFAGTGTFRYIFRYFFRYFLGTFSGTFSGTFQGAYPRFEFRFRSMSEMKLETKRISGSFLGADRAFAVFLGL